MNNDVIIISVYEPMRLTTSILTFCQGQGSKDDPTDFFRCYTLVINERNLTFHCFPLNDESSAGKLKPTLCYFVGKPSPFKEFREKISFLYP